MELPEQSSESVEPTPVPKSPTPATKQSMLDRLREIKLVDEQDQLNDKMHCWKCAFSLQTLRFDANCPECGTPVNESLYWAVNWSANPRWLRRIAWGLLIVMVTFITTPTTATFDPFLSPVFHRYLSSMRARKWARLCMWFSQLLILIYSLYRFHLLNQREELLIIEY